MLPLGQAVKASAFDAEIVGSNPTGAVRSIIDSRERPALCGGGMGRRLQGKVMCPQLTEG